MMDEPSVIDHFDLQKGWTVIPGPIGCNGTTEELMRAGGFALFTGYGNERSPTSLGVYAHTDGRFMVNVDTFDSWRHVAVSNFPSLIAVLQLLSPMVQMATMTELMGDIRELHHLLTAYESGPLEEPLREQAAVRRRRAEEWRARK